VCGGLLDPVFLCDGRRLFDVGFALMTRTYAAVMERSGWGYDELDLVFSHEASKRFVDDGLAKLGERDNPGPKLWSTVERFGNTSTFSLALQMSEALEAGALTPGAKVLMLGGAAGASMAAVTMLW
jgi:3-oxoacyl-[acyl-carrier-protein] synthase-3